MKSDKSQLETEYRSLIDYAKFISRWVIGAIAIVGSAVAFFTYQSANDLKDEFVAQADRLKTEAQELDKRRQQEYDEKLELAQKRVDAIYENAQREIEFVEKRALVFAEASIQQKVSEELTKEKITSISEAVISESIVPVLTEKIKERLDRIDRDLNADRILAPIIERLSSNSISATAMLIDSSYMSTSPGVRKTANARVMRSLTGRAYQNIHGIKWTGYSRNIQHAINYGPTKISHQCGSIPYEVIESLPLIFKAPTDYLFGGVDTSKLVYLYEEYNIIPYDFTCYNESKELGAFKQSDL